jgi:uncharacterized cysteine cluster protein YcgN (CxxCxxCC family)
MTAQAQHIDYERDCKRCGKCCSPQFLFRGNLVRFKNLRCRYLGADNLCTIYEYRKEVVGCYLIVELPKELIPMGCAFKGSVPDIDVTPDDILKHFPDWFAGTLITGLFDWR